MASNDDNKLPYIPIEEIEKHDNENSCYIILRDKVYDVTTFVNDHPGGSHSILGPAGSDATDDFEEAGHSKEARELLPQYLIGQVHPDDLVKLAEKRNNDLNGDNTQNDPFLPKLLPWLVPVSVGVVITLALRYYLSSRYSSNGISSGF